jgi:predicted transcriptional regulator
MPGIKRSPLSGLGSRERQIMEVLYQLERATAAEVHERLENRPSYSTVRAMLRLLEDKRHVRHVAEGNRYVYSPTVPAGSARHSALMNVVKTFFRGSSEDAMVALIENSRTNMSDEELARLARIIRDARKD